VVSLTIISKKFEGKKFMWDGKTYETEDLAKDAEKTYKENGFETRRISEGDGFSLYTRRVVTEIVIEGEAPL
jgi:hypothetical protein